MRRVAKWLALGWTVAATVFFLWSLEGRQSDAALTVLAVPVVFSVLPFAINNRVWRERATVTGAALVAILAFISLGPLFYPTALALALAADFDSLSPEND